MFKLLTNYEVDKKIKDLELSEKITAKITSQDSYTFDLKNLISFIIDLKLGKYFNRGTRSFEVKEPSILEFISCVIREELINDIDNTIEIYKRYMSEKNIDLFLDNSIGNIAVEDLLEQIILNYKKQLKVLEVPISLIHRNKKDRDDLKKDIVFKELNLGSQVKKDLFFLFIDEKINEKIENSYNIFEEISYGKYEEKYFKEEYKSLFNPQLNFSTNLDNFIKKYPILKTLNLHKEMENDKIFIFNDYRLLKLEYKKENGDIIEVHNLKIDYSTNSIGLTTSKENPNILKNGYIEDNCLYKK